MPRIPLVGTVPVGTMPVGILPVGTVPCTQRAQLSQLSGGGIFQQRTPTAEYRGEP